MARSRKQLSTAEDGAPVVPAPEPCDAVPEPTPPPAERRAPYISAGIAAEIQANGSAVDPFTGVTLTADDLA